MAGSVEKTAVSKALRGLIAATRVGGNKKTYRALKESVPKYFRKNISEKDFKKAWRGYQQQGSESTDSLLAFIPAMAAEKLIGQKKVRNFLWSKVNSPALKADTALGGALSKVPGMRRLFTAKETIPWGKKQLREVERSSALAPLVKVRNIAAPILVGTGIERGLSKLREHNKNKGNEPMDRDLREKVASTMLRLDHENKEHTKRAHALRFIYKKAEVGLEQVPQTFEELEQKIASLMTQDLVVLEKALELAGGQLKLGELDSTRDSTSAFSATEKFQAAILGDEI